LPRSFREYGEAVLKHLENVVASDSKLVKAPVNYEGVRSLISGAFPPFFWEASKEGTPVQCCAGLGLEEYHCGGHNSGSLAVPMAKAY